MMKKNISRLMIIIVMVCFAKAGLAQEEVLTWSDEFEGTGAPDPANWGYDIGNNGWGNNEIQTYTNSTSNSRQEGGVLIIDALKYGNTWTSARLLTNNKHEFKYGRIVFRAKLPVGSGTWPALWMLGENFKSVGWPACGEIDVMEHVGKDPGYVHSALHTPSSHGNTVNTEEKYISTFNTEFHTYEVKWTYEKMEFRVDDILFYTYKPSVRNGSTWPFDKPFFIIMNIAMGGNWGSDPQYETGGLKNGIDPALTSARMEVDYVRVYQYPNAIDEPSGNNQQGLEKPFVTPNPSTGKVMIQLPEGYYGKGTIFNLMGNDVFHFQAQNTTTYVDISSLPKGLYLLSISSGGITSTQKIILN